MFLTEDHYYQSPWRDPVCDYCKTSINVETVQSGQFEIHICSDCIDRRANACEHCGAWTDADARCEKCPPPGEAA